MFPPIMCLREYSNGSAALVACGLFDEESGKSAEDKSLNASTKPVKVEAGDCWNSDGQPGEEDAQVRENAKHTQDGNDYSGNQQFLLFASHTEYGWNCTKDSNCKRNKETGAYCGEESMTCCCQSCINQGADDSTGKNVSEVTAGHRARSKALTHHIDGGHYENGIQESF